MLFIVIPALYLMAIRPYNKRKDQLKPYQERYIAHRGLFNNCDIPENSVKAFELAVKHGYGMELDVQLTKDNRMIVFHDDSLDRMCGVQGSIQDYTFEELQQFSLINTEHKIPLFTDVLKTVAGKAPLIVEIKPEGDYKETVKVLQKIMEDYEGTYCIESFHPMAVNEYRKTKPEVIRGFLSTRAHKGSGLEGFLTSNLLLNWYIRPDFIAYNHKYQNKLSLQLVKKLWQGCTIAYPIKSEEELAKARSIFDVFIFDSFIPEED